MEFGCVDGVVVVDDVENGVWWCGVDEVVKVVGEEGEFVEIV